MPNPSRVKSLSHWVRCRGRPHTLLLRFHERLVQSSALSRANLPKRC